MENSNNFLRANKSHKGNTPIEHLRLLKNNALLIIAVVLVSLAASIVYAYINPDYFTSTTTIKIADPKGSILRTPLEEDYGGYGGTGKDRLIANEIKTLYNNGILKMVANMVLDSIKAMSDKADLNPDITSSEPGNPDAPLREVNSLAGQIAKSVSITQPPGLDFIEIAVTTSSPEEAALIANTYAEAYKEYNLMENRNQLSHVKDFLLQQSQEKLSELILAENDIKTFQLEGGVVELDKQASSLISIMTDFESRRNATKIELSLVKEKLDQYRGEIKKRDPSLSSYLQNKSTEPYINLLQEQIAKVETQKDIALSNKNIGANSPIIKEYDSTLISLKRRLNENNEKYRSGVLASSPEEIKQLSKTLFEEEVNYQSLMASYSQLNSVINSYESKFNQLPANTLELARLERERQTLEKLYLILEEKYQEALILEQSTPGNVYVLNPAQPNWWPAGPNRMYMSVIGLLVGLGLALGFVYVRNYFDVTVKSPDDILRKNLNLIGWVPKISTSGKNAFNNIETIVTNYPESIPSESFRTLRTRIHFSKMVKDAKTLLVTSAAPAEGKSIVSSNLAISFAFSEAKTVLIDCDLRRSSIHYFYNMKKSPGLVDYFLGQAPFESIVRKSDIKNLSIITAGKTPPNPSEIISSQRMQLILQRLRDDFDIIILDSPPIMAVSDSEILSRLVDMSLLVVNSGNTKQDWMENSVDLLNNEKNSFLGILLNSYSYKEGQHSYHHYYNYSSKEKSIKAKKEGLFK